MEVKKTTQGLITNLNIKVLIARDSNAKHKQIEYMNSNKKKN